MANDDPDELEAYVKKEITKGFSKDEVKDALDEAGHSKEVIDKVLSKIKEPEKKESKSEKPKISVKPLLIALVLLIVISGGIYSIRFLPKMQETKPEAQQSPRETNILEDEGYVEYVKEQMEKCMMEQVPMEPSCMAMLKDDVSLCEQSKFRSTCIDNYHRAKASITSDIQYCNQIVDASKKEGCEITVNKNPAVCAAYAGDKGAFCEALANRDLSKCESINNEALKGNCKDFLLLLKSVKEESDIACNEIGYAYFKGICFALATKKESFCRTGEQIKCHDLTFFRDGYLGGEDLDLEELSKVIGISS
jgi:hypothetical protein